MLMVIVASCADENLAPVVTFDSAIKGAYPKLTDEGGSKLLNFLTPADFDASSYNYTLKFIDANGGKNVANFTLDVHYDPKVGATGSPVELRSYSTSDFTADADGMYLKDITITAADVTSALGLTYADLTAGDKFVIVGTIIQANGLTHTDLNSSSAVTGAAFGGYFDFDMPVACPSDLSGTYSYVTAASFCAPGDPITGTVDIVNLGAGIHTFSDNSFGSYDVCYGAGMTGGIKFTDVCTVVAFTAFDSQYGETWSFVTSITGNDWRIQGTNVSYSPEFYDVTITFPGGVPFTLAP